MPETRKGGLIGIMMVLQIAKAVVKVVWILLVFSGARESLQEKDLPRTVWLSAILVAACLV